MPQPVLTKMDAIKRLYASKVNNHLTAAGCRCVSRTVTILTIGQIGRLVNGVWVDCRGRDRGPGGQVAEALVGHSAGTRVPLIAGVEGDLGRINVAGRDHRKNRLSGQETPRLQSFAQSTPFGDPYCSAATLLQLTTMIVATAVEVETMKHSELVLESVENPGGWTDSDSEV